MNRFVTKQGKVFGKINLLDLIIVLIVLIALIGGLYKMTFVDKTIYIPEYKEGYVTVKLLNLSDRKVAAIKAGDVLSVPNVQKLGEVVEINVAPRTDNVNSVDGTVYTIDNPLYSDVTVKLKTDELMTRNDYTYVGKNYKLLKGQSLDVTNGILPCKATIVSIEIA